MPLFNLYRSGILDATVDFGPNGVYYRERNLTNNEWEKSILLTEEKAQELENYYHINPITINERFDEYQEVFQTNSKKIKTSWDAIYHKHETEAHLWVEREKKFPLDVVIIDGEPAAFISTSRENCSVLVKDGLEKYTAVHMWQQGNVSPAKHSVKHHGHFMIPMRDGIKLATDVWLPTEHEDPVPVIFVRTPYGRMALEKAYVHFIQRGYGVVIQDTRGRQDSEGDWMPNSTEVEDGDDSLNWIAGQTWCDGNIGMIGASYGGFVQWAAAASGNPHLKALISIVTAGSPFIDIPRKGGAFVSGMLAWTFAMVEKEFKPENMQRDDWDEVLKTRPIKDIPKKALGMDVPFWNAWMNHPVNDEFWEKASWSRQKNNIRTPAMIMSGWYDDNGMGTTEALDAAKKFAAEDKKIILGPWMHNANTTRDMHGVHFGNNALRYDLDYQFQLWFDRKLKGIDNGMDASPVAEYYDAGTNEWKHAETWPPENVEWTKLYLNSCGNAVSSEGNGVLQRDRVKGSLSHSAENDIYTFDPEHPAPHLIDMSENEIGVPADYQNVEKRNDVLVYTSEPLNEPITIAGDIQVKFSASSSAKDTDWIVRVTDVAPDGRSIKLADGVLRARFRHGYDKEILLEPGKIEKYEIRTSKIANTFKRGHRIRLTITSSADNFIFPNSNTGNDPATDTETVIAEQRVFHSLEHVSYMELPIIK
ncbi:CocE/NonD family hydrolase [Virgibacillus doumboii]|uniref:CocE/NonD family hydrolase n=1 Tax=Virgibacillus doumboii TaxID=2697503 RepID=UPI0013E0C37A|nr:CocE/NonD family hydrolase [Virgibacillus doumboii]